MKNWYRLVSSDITNLPDCIDFYEEQLTEARRELTMRGATLEKHGSNLPGIVENRFSQLQEIEAILEYLNIELRKLKTAKFRKFLEHYNKQLSSRDAEKFAEGEVDVVNMAIAVNDFALVRNKYLAVMKGLDSKNWMISNITKLRCAGLDDAQVD